MKAQLFWAETSLRLGSLFLKPSVHRRCVVCLSVGHAASPADKDSGGAGAGAGVGAGVGPTSAEGEGGSAEASEPTVQAWKAWISGTPWALRF